MTELAFREPPHYFDVKLSGHPNGVPQMHCSRESDAINMCERYPGSEYTKIYLPHSPQTVDVPHVRVAPDLELPMQQVLPESELIPVDFS